MEWEQLAIIAQIVTGIATLAVAMFLASQLWQQHRDSVMSLRLTIGTQVDDMNRSMYTNRDFANIFLLGCEDSGELDKIDQHRFNIYMLQYFAQFKDHWENGNDYTNIQRRVKNIFGVGPGVERFWSEIGANLHEGSFDQFIDSAKSP